MALSLCARRTAGWPFSDSAAAGAGVAALVWRLAAVADLMMTVPHSSLGLLTMEELRKYAHVRGGRHSHCRLAAECACGSACIRVVRRTGAGACQGDD
ncbi:hypothetical protein [Xanthomonas fragariae]|uniref:Uncharacterized protein n=1 Tax=Xanthomonas fragariae TaxID=48664 RepID=A0ABY1RMR3_9XANT|nr:hypothetical protein [Xanthomonas fragariae]WIY74161.1 hypothetical protein OW158_06445 [Xanthomonas fragariae]SMQ98537.1 hypothetical protein PD885_01286 [Xanthomonas fragariae]